jgi:hypothetical protein
MKFTGSASLSLGERNEKNHRALDGQLPENAFKRCRMVLSVLVPTRPCATFMTVSDIPKASPKGHAPFLAVPA